MRETRERTPGWRSWVKEYQVLVALGIVAGAWILWELRAVAAVIIGGYVVAAATLPLVDFFERHRFPRIMGVIISGLAILVIVGGINAAIVAGVRNAFGSAIVHEFDQAMSVFSSFGINLSQVRDWVTAYAASITFSTFSAIAGVLSAIAIGLYTAYDWNRFPDRLAGAISNGEMTRRVLAQQVRTLGAWFRGQLVLSGIVGVLMFFLLMSIGFPYALVLGIIAGVFELVPYAGPVLAAVPGLILAIPMGLSEVLLVLAVYVIVQQAENHLLAPLVMKHAVYLHPIAVIAAILSGYEAMGIIGALLAVPFVSLVWVTYEALREGASQPGAG